MPSMRAAFEDVGGAMPGDAERSANKAGNGQREQEGGKERRKSGGGPTLEVIMQGRHSASNWHCHFVPDLLLRCRSLATRGGLGRLTFEDTGVWASSGRRHTGAGDKRETVAKGNRWISTRVLPDETRALR